jgi:sulfate transporter 4
MQLSIGPMAIISLLISTSMQSLGYDQLSSTEYVEYAEVMSFNCGIQLFIMGILSMGQLTNFLSSSVISGFTTGSAILIALTQIKYILGYENVPRFVYTHDLIIYLLVNIGNTNLVAFFIGIISIIFLYWVKLWKQNNKPSGRTNDRKFKVLYALSNGSSLATIFFGILIAYITISNKGILPVVGHIPSGFKMPAIPKKLNVKTMRDLFPSSFILSLVIFMNNWAVAVKYAAKNKYEVNANLELIASGVSNLSGSFFNCFPSAGGLARSSVNAESGAQTPLSGVITGLLIFISLISITSIFYYIPMASLGAIIQISVISMMDFEQLKYAYKVDKNDFIVILTTILITIFVSPMYGIILGLFTSMLFVIESCAFPNIAHLGRVSMNTDNEENMYNNSGSKEYYYKDIKRFENAVQIPGRYFETSSRL